MAISVIILNNWLIKLIGINGAALASLLVVILYSVIKVLYINLKLNIQPLSLNTVKLVGLIMVVFGLFYFWNFSFHPLVNIGLNCILISGLYLLLIKKVAVSTDINLLIKKYFKVK
jgi:O-antigen/teichoic acid export membrane protein